MHLYGPPRQLLISRACQCIQDKFLRQLPGANNCRLNNATRRAACAAGVARRRPTHRGCRGGAHKQRRTQVKQTVVNNDNLLSITLDNQVRTAKFCLINSRSVCNKAEFLVDYVTSHDIDIMCITETWLHSADVHCLSTAIVQSEFATFRHLPYRMLRSC